MILDTVRFEGHKVLEDVVHYILLLRVCSEAHVGLEVASGERRYICWRRGCLVLLAVVDEEQSRLNRANIRSREVAALTSERFVDDSNDWSAFESDSDEVGHSLKISLNKGLSPVDRVDPDCNVIRIELFSVRSSDEVDGSGVLLNHLSELLLVVLCLLETTLGCLHKQAGG